jgi:hypothetical protein
MRRFLILVVFLSGLFVLDAFTARAKADSSLRVATFQCDATPSIDGHPLIWVVPVKEVEDPLLAKGIVLENRRDRYVLCAVDWCGLCNSSYDLFREKIAAAAKTDASRVAVHCVHQHTAPYTDGDAQRLLDQCDHPPKYVDFEFLDEVTDRLGAAVAEALKRFESFDHVGIGQATVERVASSRRIPRGDGGIFGRMSGTTDPKLQALPEGRIDPMLKTITFARGDKPLVRMHYYATHPQSFYGDPRACSDVPGFARKRLEDKEDVFQIYFTGCSGDVAMGKYNNRTPEARAELTDRLHAGMVASVAATKFVPIEHLRWRSVPLRLPERKDPGYTVADNRAKMVDPNQSVVARVRAATRIAFTKRIDRPIDVSLLEMGPAKMLHLPGECMIEFQLFAQSLQPDGFVAVAAYGDLGPGYICTEQSFSEGGYEPSASRAGRKSEHVLKAAIRQLIAGE